MESERRSPGKTIQFVFTRVDRVPAQDGHQPGMDQVIRLDKPAGESRRQAMNEPGRRWRGWIQWKRNQSTARVHRKLICVMAIHEEAVDVERAIVEAEVSTRAVERLSDGQDRGITEQGLTAEALHRAAVEIISAEIDV